MSIGLVGRKCGMTRIFTEAGASVPVTVIEIQPNRVVQIKSIDTDGYNAIQVTTGVRKRSRVNKPLVGHYAKAYVEPGRLLREFRVDTLPEYKAGDEIPLSIFEGIKLVDVAGVTKGRGFAGTVKRHHFRTQDATHGNSRSHRVPGSIGQNQDPGRVFKGKKMAGHMGNVNRTTQNLELVKIDAEKGLLLVKGAIPGSVGGNVIVQPAVKARHGEE